MIPDIMAMTYCVALLIQSLEVIATFDREKYYLFLIHSLIYSLIQQILTEHLSRHVAAPVLGARIVLLRNLTQSLLPRSPQPVGGERNKCPNNYRSRIDSRQLIQAVFMKTCGRDSFYNGSNACYFLTSMPMCNPCLLGVVWTCCLTSSQLIMEK